VAGFARLLLGLVLLPACWGVARAAVDSLGAAAARTGGFSVEAISLLGGVLLFSICWMVVPHPVKTYVLGHELTHALWGLLFGARPSNVRVGASGGSVRLSKSNFIITLAPYFFPFYTFVVIVLAALTALFVRPLPLLPLWLFLVGFTWAFHVLFTLETLSQRQPDVKLYGRIFSWTFVFLANVLLVQVWLATTTSLSFAQLFGFLSDRIASAYAGVGSSGLAVANWVSTKCFQT